MSQTCPKEIRIKDFTYELPENRIAKYPLKERDKSKLLIYNDGVINENIYENIDKYIPENSLLVFNDSKVIHARILFKNIKGEKIEIFCLEPSDENSEPVLAMTQKKNIKWNCLVGRMNKWKEKILQLNSDKIKLFAEISGKKADSFEIEFSWQPEDLTFYEVLEIFGKMPIPPYLKRNSEDIDNSRYQTIYAGEVGSVAAPTAGLHFTQNIFKKLNFKNTDSEYISLHVGAGTFKPVKSEIIKDHIMHTEWIDVKKDTIQKLKEKLISDQNNSMNAPKIIAVGTTSLRTLESLYWMGLKTNLNPNSNLNELEVKQWDPYEINAELTSADSLSLLLNWMDKNNYNELICKTQIFIVPSYILKITDALITNFHQPGSTLLLLVAAVTGNDWEKIYKYALENEFRFLSYGDGNLIFAKKD